jgi:hypothetical protein
MFTIPAPTKDIPIDPTNLSPALAAMAAVILTPNQYARIMRGCIESCNAKCKGVQQYIGK